MLNYYVKVAYLYHPIAVSYYYKINREKRITYEVIIWLEKAKQNK